MMLLPRYNKHAGACVSGEDLVSPHDEVNFSGLPPSIPLRKEEEKEESPQIQSPSKKCLFLSDSLSRN